MTTVTQDELLRQINYNPDTGFYTWPNGKRAGTPNKTTGYIEIRINGKNYLGHRIAWLYVYGVMPPNIIDHKNRIRDDNRIDNLRLASHAENSQNLGTYKSNTSGYTGVTFHKGTGKWVAQIVVNYKKIHLGLFETPELAHQAYLEAKAKYHLFHSL